jgi:hypothetical protein
MCGQVTSENRPIFYKKKKEKREKKKRSEVFG